MKSIRTEYFDNEITKYISSIELTYPMATTISISKEMKENLKNLGRAGDSYEDVIQKMYEITKKTILMNYLYDESDSITIKEARKRLKNGKSNNN